MSIDKNKGPVTAQELAIIISVLTVIEQSLVYLPFTLMHQGQKCRIISEETLREDSNTLLSIINRLTHLFDSYSLLSLQSTTE